jgi:two-component system chemotaxis response regulator CheB
MTDSEKKLVFLLAQKLTGVHPDGTYHHGIFLTNVERRMRERGVSRLVDYLKIVDEEPDEHSHLLSSLSIHTTSWFRENPHAVAFQQILLNSIHRDRTFKVWSSACSTGEEVYTFALLLEEFRRFNAKFDYKILGTDIDPLCLEKARKGVYPKKHLSGPIRFYKNHVLLGSGSTENFFTFSKAIRGRCEFKKHDIRTQLPGDEKFDVIICRNVLIYFSPEQVDKIVTNLLERVTDVGHLMLGHSEIIDHAAFKLHSAGHSVYRKGYIAEAKGIANAKPTAAATITAQGKPKVLIVDDSRTVREYLRKEFDHAGLEADLVDSARQAEQQLKQGRYDLITLDLNMPNQTGEEWLKQIRRQGVKTPIVIISNTHASQRNAVVSLLSEGAQAYIEKEDLTKNPELLMKTVMPLIETVRQNSNLTSIKLQRRPPTGYRPDVILIGASTGGPGALSIVLKDLPPWTPPIVLVQHISMKFSEPFANRMSEISHLRLGKIEDGEKLQSGCLYVALGDYHLGIKQENDELKLVFDHEAARNGHRPSVDQLFYSANAGSAKKMAILLTGMGKDGADGLKALHNSGAYTLAQSEEDCVVFGMPREAIVRNAVDFVGNCREISNELRGLIDSLRAVGF